TIRAWSIRGMIISVSMPVVSAPAACASTLGTPDRGTDRPEIRCSAHKALQPPSMHARPSDLLSRLLAHWRSDRAVTARFSLSAPWALRSAGVEGALIRMCAGAPYLLAVKDQ